MFFRRLKINSKNTFINIRNNSLEIFVQVDAHKSNTNINVAMFNNYADKTHQIIHDK